MYETEEIHHIDFDQIKKSKEEYKHLNNENSTLAVKSHTLNDDSEKVPFSHSHISPITQSSQGQQKSYLKQDIEVENYMGDLPDEQNSKIEFDYRLDSKHIRLASSNTVARN